MDQSSVLRLLYALLICAILSMAGVFAVELATDGGPVESLRSETVLRKGRRLFLAGGANGNESAAENLSDPGGGIYNGEAAEEGEFPYLTSLRLSGNHFCGGVLIAPNVVLTAAHCVITPQGRLLLPDVSVGLLGIRDTKSERATVEEFKTCETIIHRDFDLHRIQDGYDIALLVLDGNSVAELVDVDRGSINLQEGDPVTAAGFGGISNNVLPDKLLKTEKLQYVNLEVCESGFSIDFPDSTMCAFDPLGGSDVCRGDSGGPLLTSDKRTVVGIVSFGPLDCTDVEVPSVYTRVSSFVEFIDTMGQEDGESTVKENCFPETTMAVPLPPEEPSSPTQQPSTPPEEGVTAESIAAAIAAGDTDAAADLIIQAVEEGNEDVVVEAMEQALAEGNRDAAGEAVRAAIRKGVSLQKIFPALRVLDP